MSPATIVLGEDITYTWSFGGHQPTHVAISLTAGCQHNDPGDCKYHGGRRTVLASESPYTMTTSDWDLDPSVSWGPSWPTLSGYVESADASGRNGNCWDYASVTLILPPPPPPSPAGSRYTYYEGPTSWSDARAACQARGGDLAMPRNAADDAAAFNAVGPGKRAYIGLSDRGTEGTFVWVDGEPAGLYLNWGPSEPNSYGGTDEDCAGYHTYYPSGQWNDFPCGGVDPNDSNAPIGYVCEVGAPPLFVVRPTPLELNPRHRPPQTPPAPPARPHSPFSPPSPAHTPADRCPLACTARRSPPRP